MASGGAPAPSGSVPYAGLAVGRTAVPARFVTKPHLGNGFMEVAAASDSIDGCRIRHVALRNCAERLQAGGRLSCRDWGYLKNLPLPWCLQCLTRCIGRGRRRKKD